MSVAKLGAKPATTNLDRLTPPADLVKYNEQILSAECVDGEDQKEVTAYKRAGMVKAGGRVLL